MSVIDILEELEATAGSNAKRDILELNRKNELLKRVFVAAFDPYTVFYVNKVKMPKPSPAELRIPDDEALEAFLMLLGELSSRKLTGNAAKDAVHVCMSAFGTKQQKWCQRILLRNLRCGVQVTTVNKVWPNTIKPFSVALAQTLKSEFVKGEGIKLLEPVQYPCRVEPKLDGLRCIAVKKNGEVTFYTRNGTILETLPTIKAALEGADYDNIVLDGEGMSVDWNQSASVMMSSKSKKDDKDLVYNVFDAMPLEDWVSQKTTTPYSTRSDLVASIIPSVWSCYPRPLQKNAPVRQVPHVMVNNEAELKEYFAKCLDEGFEGVMIKRTDTPYEFDRSRNLLKLKPCATAEGVVVSIYEGRRGTKHEGRFGGFEVVFPNGVITRVGSGFNDVMRAEVQLDPNTWIGKVVECEFQPDPVSKDGYTADGKLRFPVFCRERSPVDVDPQVLTAYKKFMEVG